MECDKVVERCSFVVGPFFFVKWLKELGSYFYIDFSQQVFLVVSCISLFPQLRYFRLACWGYCYYDHAHGKGPQAPEAASNQMGGQSKWAMKKI